MIKQINLNLLQAPLTVCLKLKISKEKSILYFRFLGIPDEITGQSEGLITSYLVKQCGNN